VSGKKALEREEPGRIRIAGCEAQERGKRYSHETSFKRACFALYRAAFDSRELSF
jgi:hypothetical protein